MVPEVLALEALLVVIELGYRNCQHQKFLVGIRLPLTTSFFPTIVPTPKMTARFSKLSKREPLSATVITSFLCPSRIATT
jgi:hypothetical protein